MIGSYLSPFGYVIYEWVDGAITSIYFSDENEGKSQQSHPKVNQELDMFFKHQSTKMDLNVRFTKGTLFQQTVWNALLEIPFGKTWSYQQLANYIKNPKAVRAVGQACKRNPIGLLVPCHRVIGSDGSMTGYSGKAYVDLKKRILDFEKELTHD